MNVRDFLYWVRGYFELNGHTRLNKYQLEIIRDHLKLVAVNRSSMSEDDAHFLAHIYYVVDAWLNNSAFDQQVPEKYAKQFDDLIKEQFEQVTKKIRDSDNPFLSSFPYESLGDIYNSQRLC
jgi:hypothetical protein